MARPRKFNEQQVLDRALEIFWRKGYQATSFDDLVATTGLGRGSLVAAFGDKEKLFLRVLDHYIQQRAERVLGMDTGGDARTRLEVLLHGWVGMTNPQSGPSGCFLSLSGLSGDAPEVARQKFLSSLEELRMMFACIIAQGQQQGELCTDVTSDELAAVCVVVLQGIAATARAGWQANDLHGVASKALDSFLRRPGEPSKRTNAIKLNA